MCPFCARPPHLVGTRLCETATPCWDPSVRDRRTLLGMIYNVTPHFFYGGWRMKRLYIRKQTHKWRPFQMKCARVSSEALGVPKSLLSTSMAAPRGQGRQPSKSNDEKSSKSNYLIVPLASYVTLNLRDLKIPRPPVTGWMLGCPPPPTPDGDRPSPRGRIEPARARARPDRGNAEAARPRPTRRGSAQGATTHHPEAAPKRRDHGPHGEAVPKGTRW